MDKFKLPTPKDERGYTRSELLLICNSYKLDSSKFFDTLGVNTCSVNEQGETLTYKSDVVNTLHKITKREIFILGLKIKMVKNILILI